MDFQKYLDNLENQLKAVNADIIDKQEELEKLQEFKLRVKGGIEVVKQIQSEVPQPPSLEQEIRNEVKQMARPGGDMDTL